MKQGKDDRELQEQFHRMVKESLFVSADEIPRIDLYMDQVLTFMEEHLKESTRDPEHDKILTKTMINNYVKNDVLIPPVRKKYGMDHMILLLMVYYLKSYLSIGDIGQVLKPCRNGTPETVQERKTSFPWKRFTGRSMRISGMSWRRFEPMPTGSLNGRVGPFRMRKERMRPCCGSLH